MRYYKGVNLMDNVTKKYIETVQVGDIPWHRLTTTYARATDFPRRLMYCGIWKAWKLLMRLVRR